MQRVCQPKLPVSTCCLLAHPSCQLLPLLDEFLFLAIERALENTAKKKLQQYEHPVHQIWMLHPL